MAPRRGPERTCVGCRAKAAKADLLRVVAVEGHLVPDPAGRLPGRGASVHPDLQCVALAEKRRAFGRALRLAAAPDVGPVREHLQARGSSTPWTTAPAHRTTSTTSTPPPAAPVPDGPARREQAPP